MDAQWIGVTVAALAAMVSLAAFIRSGFQGIRLEIRNLSRQQREDFQTLSQRQREDRAKLEEAVALQARQQREDHAKLEGAIALQARQQREDFQTLSQRQREDHAKLAEKLTEIAERTARIEGILVSQGWAEFRVTAAQAVPDEQPE